MTLSAAASLRTLTRLNQGQLNHIKKINAYHSLEISKIVQIYSTNTCSSLIMQHRFFTSQTEDMKRRDGTTASESLDKIYLHVAPCGDWWTGHTMFAAKHLQPDYVKSIPLPSGFDPDEVFADYCDDKMKNIYDSGKIPADLIKMHNTDI
mmetsp:Transcript_28079/g.32351  ORF Transcript_28079/g.32351 Transcript_28079/m.32351 type:complete len:150 (-) Transcript_28079:252-701(-)|eukprot:CAMPEP_0194392624 /NCGR_PEP_ID=MMETSP0174-20130528/122833_1 /TAXON_ID=216777 /ORGANISM="Proboscia alata, Strain PI-D3" /LENGTH=149 /DNA_ID=CAMNT_0039188213 /DNA_START=74 /DNA_END=523 /DNA_ORIENTATION=-